MMKKAAWILRRSSLGRAAAPLVAQSVYQVLKLWPALILKNPFLRRWSEVAQLWAVLDPRGAAIPISFGPLRGFSILNDPAPHFPTFRALGIAEVMNQVLFERTIQPGEVIYDVGANVGLHTLLLSRLCGSEGKVYAFEPWPENAEKLAANLELNYIRNVEVIPWAVASRSRLAKFRAGPDNSQGKLIDDSSQAASRGDFEVQAISLDDFVAQRGGRAPSLIKIDVEGGEGEALRGASQLLREVRPIVICEIHSEVVGEVVRAILTEAGYDCFVLEAGFRPVGAGGSLPHWCHVCACHNGEARGLARIPVVRPGRGSLGVSDLRQFARVARRAAKET